jgi:hypothetical protein
MRFLKRAILALVVLIALLVVIGFLLPSKYRVERSVTMRASPDKIFALVNTLKTWPDWTAWNTQRYPDMKTTFTGPDAGVGAQYDWTGKEVGTGFLKITASDPNKGIEYDLNFEDSPTNGSITMAPTADGVKVTWANWGDLGMNPVGRYFGLLMDRFMGPDFETGLNNLKKKVESQ